MFFDDFDGFDGFGNYQGLMVFVISMHFMALLVGMKCIILIV